MIGTCLLATVAEVSALPTKVLTFGKNKFVYPVKSTALYAEAGIELAVAISSNSS